MVKATYYGTEVDLDFEKEKLPPVTALEEIDVLFPEGRYEHGFFETTTPGGKLLHYRVVTPPEDVPLKGIVVWNHGISASVYVAHRVKSTGKLTNFALLAEHFTSRGYAMYMLDMKGHGLSEGIRFLVRDWKFNRDDLIGFAQFASKKHEDGTPLFVCGDSYGGNLAIHVGRAFQDKTVDVPKGFRGLCLSAPAIVGDLPPEPIVYVLRYWLAPKYPMWTPFFMPNPIHSTCIWSDPEVRGMHTHPKVVELGLQSPALPFRLGTADNLMSALEHAREHSVPGLDVPFCVSHGVKDQGVPIAGTINYLLAKSSTPAKDKLFNKEPEGFHDLWAEPNAEDIARKVADWMDSRLDKPYVSDSS